MQEIINKLNNDLDLPEYDVLLIGDGSGTVSTKCSAWGCFRFLLETEKLDYYFGGSNLGTNNFAELIPYLNVLWLDHYEGHDIPRRVQIISDSELTVKCATGEYARNYNLPIWNIVDYFKKLGYDIKWKHIARNSNQLHALCDKYAGQLRKEMERFQLTGAKECVMIEQWMENNGNRRKPKF